MRIINRLLFIITLLAGCFTPAAFAADTDPLFVNLTTDDPHRANMGITFGLKQFQRGHPLTILLNDKGVFIGAKTGAERFAMHQKLLAELIGKGATVLICPMCMKQYGITEADLIPGVKLGSPEITGDALFKDNTKALSW